VTVFTGQKTQPTVSVLKEKTTLVQRDVSRSTTDSGETNSWLT